MGRIFTIGEMLIDFLPNESNKNLEEVSGFIKMPGGAPANVAVCASKLGADAYFVGKFSEDNFGDFLINTLKSNGVDASYTFRCDAKTALAFVANKANGEREFSFYRNNSADMLLTEEEVSEISLNENDILSFCSVDLVECPTKYATKKMLENGKRSNSKIVFDPNLRFNLWDDHNKLFETVHHFIKYADLLKVSDEEIEFLANTADPFEAFDYFNSLGVKNIIVTLGKDGVIAKFGNRVFESRGIKVKAIDTTGAGDSFLGSILYKLDLYSKYIEDLSDIEIQEMLDFANKVAALVTTKKGAINSLPSIDEII